VPNSTFNGKVPSTLGETDMHLIEESSTMVATVVSALASLDGWPMYVPTPEVLNPKRQRRLAMMEVSPGSCVSAAKPAPWMVSIDAQPKAVPWGLT
jgi:hypothetical protein